MSVALISIFIVGSFIAGTLIGLLLFSRKSFVDLIKWLRPSVEGQDGKAAGKPITAFIFTVLVIVIALYSMWFAVYALLRQSAISANELTAAHYPLEFGLYIIGGVLGLWSVGMVGNALMTKFTTPQPPATNVNIQSEKTNVQGTPGA